MAEMTTNYTRIVWENYPSTETPINESNLNRMDSAIYSLQSDTRTLNTVKAEQSDLLSGLRNVTYDTQTGVFIFTWFNGTTLSVDLNVEKIPVSFSMSEQGVITMTNADGTKYTADVSELITNYTFADSGTVKWTLTPATVPAVPPVTTKTADTNYAQIPDLGSAYTWVPSSVESDSWDDATASVICIDGAPAYSSGDYVLSGDLLWRVDTATTEFAQGERPGTVDPPSAPDIRMYTYSENHVSFIGSTNSSSPYYSQTAYDLVNGKPAYTDNTHLTVTADIVDGSITAAKLQPNYLADVTTQANNASASASVAAAQASNSASSAQDAEAWANGQRGGVDVDSSDPAYHNNAKYWKDQSAGRTLGGLSDVSINAGTLADKNVLVYDATSGLWKNASGLSDNNYTDSDKSKLTNLADIRSVGNGLTIDGTELLFENRLVPVSNKVVHARVEIFATIGGSIYVKQNQGITLYAEDVLNYYFGFSFSVAPTTAVSNVKTTDVTVSIYYDTLLSDGFTIPDDLPTVKIYGSTASKTYPLIGNARLVLRPSSGTSKLVHSAQGTSITAQSDRLSLVFDAPHISVSYATSDMIDLSVLFCISKSILKPV